MDADNPTLVYEHADLVLHRGDFSAPGFYSSTVKRLTLSISAKTAFEAAAEPKELMVIPGASHTDLYDKTDVIPFDKLAQFFNQHLTA